jgi:hypothetical protein
MINQLSGTAEIVAEPAGIRSVWHLYSGRGPIIGRLLHRDVSCILANDHRRYDYFQAGFEILARPSARSLWGLVLKKSPPPLPSNVFKSAGQNGQ